MLFNAVRSKKHVALDIISFEHGYLTCSVTRHKNCYLIRFNAIHNYKTFYVDRVPCTYLPYAARYDLMYEEIGYPRYKKLKIDYPDSIVWQEK